MLDNNSDCIDNSSSHPPTTGKTLEFSDKTDIPENKKATETEVNKSRNTVNNMVAITPAPEYISLTSSEDKSSTTTTGATKLENSSKENGVATNTASPFALGNRFKRKRENRASTFALQHNAHPLIGEFGGCPWQNHREKYDKGVVG